MTLNWATFFRALNLNTVSARRKDLLFNSLTHKKEKQKDIFSCWLYFIVLELELVSIKPCSRRLSLQQSTLMYWMSSMSCTSMLSSEQTVSSCNLQRTRQTDRANEIREIKSTTDTFIPSPSHKWLYSMYLVEMRLKTALKLLQLRENRTPQAEFLSSAACWFPSRNVWMK